MRRNTPFVLVVDAYPDAAESTCAVLSLYGIAAKTAASCAEAVAIARREHPAAVVTDTLLPDGDGCKLAELMRSKVRPRPAVIAIDSTARGGVDPYAEWFLKPADPGQLAAAVRRHLRQTSGKAV